MRKRNRSVRYTSKYPKHPVMTINDVQRSKAFYHATVADAPLRPGQFVAGVIEHPTTKLHQVWLSTNGLDVTCFSAHHDESRAESDLQEMKALIRSGDVYDEEKVTALFEQLDRGSDEKPSVLPDDLVREIVREILRTVVDSSQQ